MTEKKYLTSPIGPAHDNELPTLCDHIGPAILKRLRNAQRLYWIIAKNEHEKGHYELALMFGSELIVLGKKPSRFPRSALQTLLLIYHDLGFGEMGESPTRAFLALAESQLSGSDRDGRRMLFDMLCFAAFVHLHGSSRTEIDLTL